MDSILDTLELIVGFVEIRPEYLAFTGGLGIPLIIIEIKVIFDY